MNIRQFILLIIIVFTILIYTLFGYYFLKQEEEFMNLEKLLLKRKELTHKLNTIDKEIVRSPELFDMLQDKL